MEDKWVPVFQEEGFQLPAPPELMLTKFYNAKWDYASKSKSKQYKKCS